MITAAGRIQVLGVCSILEHVENSYDSEALENQGQNGCEIEKEEGYSTTGSSISPLTNASIRSIMVLLNAPCLFLYRLFAFSLNSASVESLNSGWKYIFPIASPPLQVISQLLFIFFMFSTIYTYYLFTVNTDITVKYLYYLNKILTMKVKEGFHGF